MKFNWHIETYKKSEDELLLDIMYKINNSQKNNVMEVLKDLNGCYENIWSNEVFIDFMLDKNNSENKMQILDLLPNNDFLNDVFLNKLFQDNKYIGNSYLTDIIVERLEKLPKNDNLRLFFSKKLYSKKEILENGLIDFYKLFYKTLKEDPKIIESYITSESICGSHVDEIVERINDSLIENLSNEEVIDLIRNNDNLLFNMNGNFYDSALIAIINKKKRNFNVKELEEILTILPKLEVSSKLLITLNDLIGGDFFNSMTLEKDNFLKKLLEKSPKYITYLPVRLQEKEEYILCFLNNLSESELYYKEKYLDSLSSNSNYIYKDEKLISELIKYSKNYLIDKRCNVKYRTAKNFAESYVSYKDFIDIFPPHEIHEFNNNIELQILKIQKCLPDFFNSLPLKIQSTPEVFMEFIKKEDFTYEHLDFLVNSNILANREVLYSCLLNNNINYYLPEIWNKCSAEVLEHFNETDVILSICREVDNSFNRSKILKSLPNFMLNYFNHNNIQSNYYDNMKKIIDNIELTQSLDNVSTKDKRKLKL